MRIVYFAPTVGLNDVTGDAIHVGEEVRRFRSLGHSLAVVLGNTGKDEKPEGTTDLHVVGYKRSYDSVRDFVAYVLAMPRAILLTVRLAKRFHPQILYERHVFVDMGPFLSRLLRIPSVLELNGLAAVERIGFDARMRQQAKQVSFLESKTIRGHSAYVCVTRQLANTVRNILGSEISPLVLVVGNGADVQQFVPGSSSPEELGLPQGKYIVFTGHLMKWQGLEWLIKGMRDLIKSQPSARLLIIGEGPEAQPLKSVVSELALENHVIFRGRVRHSELPEFLKLASVCVAPAAAELGAAGGLKGWAPIKVFEYMAAGKPVVLTRIGDIAETVERERLGKTIDYGDTATLISTLSAYLEQPAESTGDGARGRQWVVANQSWDEIVRRISNLLSSVEERWRRT